MEHVISIFQKTLGVSWLNVRWILHGLPTYNPVIFDIRYNESISIHHEYYHSSTHGSVALGIRFTQLADVGLTNLSTLCEIWLTMTPCRNTPGHGSRPTPLASCLGVPVLHTVTRENICSNPVVAPNHATAHSCGATNVHRD